eukprot:CAMPEP_0202002114 /NCGR_PEP_ID=MMETSP0905-20130828/8046_1 /ASSEMBLY_ACC=CAM_ASM_000554 /TAXON_ID=420261 /ORGANISM="Thalassiosira antarctica, Strain CCMP982" /LENGTH=571 /DNA_ID=CAMNT_0048558941 /DNA_START=66 /DNA_END=1781 /DNA_ORIENTATION=+
MRSLAFRLIFQLWPLASLLADGFLAGSSSPIIDCRSRMPKSIITLSVFDKESPPQPKSDIDTNALLSQAYKSLTVQQLRDLLRQKGAKVSGNKRELVDRLEAILVKGKENTQNATLRSSTQSTKLTNGGKRKLLESYNHMTLKELKDLLHQYGAKVSGNKRELVHRLMISRYENHDQSKSLPPQNNSHSKSLIKPETEGWSVLEPSVTLFNRDSNATSEDLDKSSKRKEDTTIELPPLSGLIFVNKPSGWSTLPTKQQLDNPSCPTYPCLSDSVKNWLYNHPEGKQRLKRANKEEGQWWGFTLQSMSQNRKEHKKWKKRKDKQEERMLTFEPRPVHRLDIDTSGIVCIALTPYALRASNMMFESKSRGSFEEDGQIQNIHSLESKREIGVQKRYVALTEGTLGNEQGPTTEDVIKHSIGKVWVEDHHEWACDISGNETVAFIRPGGDSSSFVPETCREAITSYRAVDWKSIKTGKDAINVTRLELTPHTGRGHQLRLHMASIGHPIVGDDMHGTAAAVRNDAESVISIPGDGSRLCLHASKLSMDAWCASADETSDGFQICRVDVESCPPF